MVANLSSRIVALCTNDEGLPPPKVWMGQCIVNPLDKRMMVCIIGAGMLLGRDAYCVKYLKGYREKKFEV
jgi:hypothetical protein